MGATQSRLRRKRKAIPYLPVEIFVLIEEFLIGDNCFGTAAKLSATCRLVHQETLTVLYATVIWQFDQFVDMVAPPALALSSLPFREYVKYFIIEYHPELYARKVSVKICSTFDHRQMFPNVKLVCFQQRCPSSRCFEGPATPECGNNQTTLTLYRPVGLATLFTFLGCILTSRRCNRKTPFLPKIVTRKASGPTISRLAIIPIVCLRFKYRGDIIRFSKAPSEVDIASFISQRTLRVELDGRASFGVSSPALGRGLAICNSFSRSEHRLHLTATQSILPVYLSSLANHWRPERFRAHNFTINHDDDFACLDRLVPKLAAVYLNARRQFYTAQNEGSGYPLKGIPISNRFIDWEADPADMVKELLDEEIEPMVRIRVSAWNPGAFVVYNADIRSGRNGVKVNVFVAVEGMSEYAGKLFSETL